MVTWTFWINALISVHHKSCFWCKTHYRNCPEKETEPGVADRRIEACRDQIACRDRKTPSTARFRFSPTAGSGSCMASPMS